MHKASSRTNSHSFHDIGKSSSERSAVRDGTPYHPHGTSIGGPGQNAEVVDALPQKLGVGGRAYSRAVLTAASLHEVSKYRCP